MKRVPGRAAVDLVAELPHEDVDRAVAVAVAPAPDPLHQLVARDDPAGLERERVEKPELHRRQLGAGPVDERLDVVGIDRQLLELSESPRASIAGRVPRLAAARIRASSSRIANGLTR